MPDAVPLPDPDPPFSPSGSIDSTVGSSDCGNCTDKTFRLRIQCVSCGQSTGCSCDSAPSTLCLRFTNASTGSSSCNSALNGKRVLLTKVTNSGPPGGFNCASPFTDNGTRPPEVYQGTFTISVGYSTIRSYKVVLGCCGPGFYGTITQVTCVGPNCSAFPQPCLFVGVLGYVDANDDPLYTEPGEETCSPYSISGQFQLLDANGSFAVLGSVDFLATPVPPEGCGGDGGCCDSELSTHPNLSVAVSGTCSDIVTVGTFPALWNGTEWVFGPTGTGGYVWKLTCPFGGLTNTWAAFGFAHGGTSSVSLTGVGSCDPASALLTKTIGPPFCTVTLSVTL